MLRCLALALLLAAPAWAQQTEPPNGVFLVAKPELADPNFRETVVLVTQTPDAHTVGVILNRPADARLQEFLPDGAPAANYADALYFGGPVMRQALVAVFRAESPPEGPAFHVLPRIYLAMQPALIDRLLESRGQRYRLYAGFSGWAPRQLESELERDSWYVLPASEDVIFRKDTAGLWDEMLARARSRGGARAPSAMRYTASGLEP